VNLVDRIPKVDGFYALSIKGAHDVEARLFQTEHEPQRALGRFVGVSQVTSSTNLMRWDPRPDYMPLVTAGQRPVFLNPSNTLKAVTATNFSPEEVVFLPEGARSQIGATNRAGARVVWSRVSEHKVEAEIDAADTSMVVVAQAWYPAWRAHVDGRPVELWRANYCFQALQVPAGIHRIKIVYADTSFRIGSLLSLLGLGLCAATAFVASRTRTA
jgi:hypothetical protein